MSPIPPEPSPKHPEGARIYNLFPRLVGSIESWPRHFDRIGAMGFNWVYVNPLHYPGFSGSLYAVKDYYSYNPMFFGGNQEKEAAERELRLALAEAHNRGLKVMMDLVINHTSIDALLVESHPEWYARKPDGSIKNAGCLDGLKEIEWGDLAQIDNRSQNPVHPEIWGYWKELVRHGLSLGFDGFRCDAAYHVPSELWKHLIVEAKKENPGVIFCGETLGCKAKETLEVADAGFDYIFNSSKYWDFQESWFLEEFRKVVGAAPSISFPESHDTPRLAADAEGDQSAIKMRYAFAAFLSTGVMIPVGFEYGFKGRLDVCSTQPHHWETPAFDLTSFIATVNEIKREHRVFNEDSDIDVLDNGNPKVFTFLKESNDGQQKALIAINTDTEGWQKLTFQDLHKAIGSSDVRDISPGHRMDSVPTEFEYHLPPGEVKAFITN